VALAVDADGIHLSWKALPASIAKQIIPQGKLVGVSTHNLEEAMKAEQQGVDYISLSPIFQTPSKGGIVPTLGPEGLMKVVQHVHIPVIALGGITEENIATVFEAGAYGISIKSRAFVESNNFFDTAQKISNTVSINK
jgi:thiamine-phosphate pyrophosphorylase